MKHIITRALILLVASGMLLGAEEEKKPAPSGGTVPARGNETEIPPPKTLEEAHAQMEKEMRKEELAKIDAMKSEEELIEYHFSLGMGMRNGWGLWGDQPLAQHMRELGFHHADDMSGVILRTFWCRRHGRDFRLKERAAYYAVYWKAAAAPPESARDPKDGSGVVWKMGFSPGLDEKTPRQIHVGQSQKTGRWLAYEHDKGVYEPDAALLRQIAEREELAPRDPFTLEEAKPEVR